MKIYVLVDSLFDILGKTFMQDFSFSILITKKAFPVKKLPRFFKYLETVEAQDDKLNLFRNRVHKNKTFLYVADKYAGF